MELRSYDNKNVFEDIIEDQIIDEEYDTFYTSSIEEELDNENFYNELESIEELLKLNEKELIKAIDENIDLRILFEKSNLDINSEDIKNELREMTLDLEMTFINNILNSYMANDELVFGSEDANMPTKDSSLLNKMYMIFKEKVGDLDDKATKWFNKNKFFNDMKKVPFFKRKNIIITAAIIVAAIVSFRIYANKSFVLNPRFYKDKMAKLENKESKYDPLRIVKTIPASDLSNLKRNSLSAISNIEKIVDDILNGADVDSSYNKLLNLNLGEFGMSFNAKKDGRLKVKRKSINRKVKKTTSELGYSTDKSYDNVVRDLNQIREKFLKTYEKIIDLQINFIENPTRYSDVKEKVVKKFLPSLISILKYIFDTVFRDFYNTAYAIK